MSNQYILRKRNGYSESLFIQGVWVDRARLEEKFWSGINKNGTVVSEGLGPCWEWTRSTNSNGYGKIFLKKVCAHGTPKRTVFIATHRLSYIVAHGPIPDMLVLRHRCNNPPCANPAHLLLGTQVDNMADAWRDGLIKPMKGEDAPGAILTEEQVVWARQCAQDRTVQLKEIAAQVGMSENGLIAAIYGTTWPHIPGDLPPRRRSRRHISEALPEVRQCLADGMSDESLTAHFGVHKLTMRRWIKIANE